MWNPRGPELTSSTAIKIVTANGSLFEGFVAVVTDLITVTTLEISPSVVYSSVWSKKVLVVHGYLEIVHGRATWTIGMDDLHWFKWGVCPCTVPSWVILRPNDSVSPGRLLGRTRVGLIFLLPYQVYWYVIIYGRIYWILSTNLMWQSFIEWYKIWVLHLVLIEFRLF